MHCLSSPFNRHDRASHRRERGFTLIELMVTISVLGVLLAIAAPSFTRLIAANKMATQTNEFVGAMNLARSEAVRRGVAVSVRSNASTLNFASGWKVFTDALLAGTPATPATANDGTIVRENSIGTGSIYVKRVTRSGSAGSYTYADSTASDNMYLTFNGRGANNASAAAFFKICDTNNTSVKGRVVQVSVVGKISLDSTSESCS
jgi:type IV fimbrial biogenesis protein FimT